MESSLLGHLEAATIQGSLFLGVVWLLCRSLGRMPATAKCWLWRLAILRFLFGLGVAVAIPVGPLPTQQISPAIAPVLIKLAASKFHQQPPRVIHPTETLQVEHRNSSAPALGFSGWLSLLWAIGSAAIVGRAFSAYRRVRQMMRRAADLDSSEILAGPAAFQLLSNLGSPPRTKALPYLGSPVLVGMFRPTIVVPSDFRQTSPAGVASAVAHELAHLQRRDVAWTFVAEFVKAVFWFNPLVWVACRQQRLQAEIAADLLARKWTRVSPREYASHLLEWIDPARGGRIQAAVVPGLVPSTHELVTRLHEMSVTRYGRGPTTLLIASLAAPLGLGLVPLSLVMRNSGLANSPWPAIHCETSNVGQGDASAATGLKAWEFQADGSIGATPIIGSDGTIYFGTAQGTFYALDPNRGVKRWSFRTGGLIASAGAVGANGLVYFGSEDGNVYALSASTGALRWKFATAKLVYSSPTIGPDGTVYIGSWDGNLYALDGATGAKKWSFQAAGPFTSSAALGPDGTLYVGNHGNRLYAINSRTGAQKWSYVSGDDVNDACLSTSGNLYAGGWDDRLFSLDAATGALRWSVRMGSAVNSCPSLGPDGTVFATSDDYRVYGFDPETGDRKWEFVTAGEIAASPAVGADETVYISSSDQQLYALDGLTGRNKWSVDLGSASNSSPSIGADGTIYVGTDNGELIAIK
jgi:outer membrane protein assembly factor BamB/beta-lactamase regulating signal transducer with metallopeptidase domain